MASGIRVTVRKGRGFFIRMLIGNYSLTICLSSASLRTLEMFNPWLELSLKAVQMGMEAQAHCGTQFVGRRLLPTCNA